jgi:hypothetical protein
VTYILGEYQRDALRCILVESVESATGRDKVLWLRLLKLK